MFDDSRLCRSLREYWQFTDARAVIAHGRWTDERLLIWLLRVHRVGGEEPGVIRELWAARAVSESM